MQRAINNAYLMIVSAIMMMRTWVAQKLTKLQTAGASHFVEILVAIIIVIAVGAVFKNQIINFINNITGNATTNANALF